MIGFAAACAVVATALAGLGATPPVAGLPPVVPEPVFRFTFEQPVAREDGVVRIPAEGGSVGTVLAAGNGVIELRQEAPGIGQRFADFPPACDRAVCPRAVVQVPDDPALDPMAADFAFGARVLMQPDDIASGSNLIQKGRFHSPGGQWKLQVDDLAGHPSCVFRGRGGSVLGGRAVVVQSRAGVADGRWHDVRCVRSAGGVSVVVDGETVRRQVPVPPIANSSPVSIGGPGVSVGDDQFHGGLDDVFLAAGR